MANPPETFAACETLTLSQKTEQNWRQIREIDMDENSASRDTTNLQSHFFILRGLISTDRCRNASFRSTGLGAWKSG